jgi:hypothetical protein
MRCMLPFFFFSQYESALAAAGACDFDDLLVLGLRLLRSSAAVVADVQQVLVDEWQDTSSIQLDLTLELVRQHGRLTVVGDPNQRLMHRPLLCICCFSFFVSFSLFLSFVLSTFRFFSPASLGNLQLSCAWE